jgi:hypothetical protein
MQVSRKFDGRFRPFGCVVIKGLNRPNGFPYPAVNGNAKPEDCAQFQLQLLKDLSYRIKEV